MLPLMLAQSAPTVLGFSATAASFTTNLSEDVLAPSNMPDEATVQSW
jgi:hypothetical protein